MDSVLKGKTVLLVDDEPDLREILAFDFKMQGCTVYEAGSGKEGFEVVKKNDIDLVVSDIRMANGTGVDLLEWIKSYNPTRPIVFLLSGFSDVSEKDAKEKGAVALFNKPFNRKELLRAITESLR
jgi:two-component system, NtrC family, response regulator HydG